MRASKNSEKFFRDQKSEKNASKLGVVSFNPNKIIFGDFDPLKIFQNFSMRAIDSSHKITPRKVIFAQIKKNFFSKVLLQSLPSFKY